MIGERIVPREPHQLFVADVTFVVDADDALLARRPAIGAGKTSAGLLYSKTHLPERREDAGGLRDSLHRGRLDSGQPKDQPGKAR